MTTDNARISPEELLAGFLEAASSTPESTHNLVGCIEDAPLIVELIQSRANHYNVPIDGVAAILVMGFEAGRSLERRRHEIDQLRALADM